MANPFLALEGVSYRLPDGRTLFSDLHERFDHRRTGLVGRNGVGKTLLARILAGQLAPSSGRCLRAATVHYLPQQSCVPPAATVASLAGVEATLAALSRIEAGSSDPEDFTAVGERWELPAQLQQALASYGLNLDPGTPATALSGGEIMRVLLAGASLCGADFLILDEPSNHLDRPARHVLLEQLERWPHGLLVISHDRPLLEHMERIVELSSLGLRSHGGNYSFYAAAREQERQGALQELAHYRHERRRTEQVLREQHERQQRRQARGAREGREANQAKILLGTRKSRSQSTAGRLHQQQSAQREALDLRVREAARQVQDETPIRLETQTLPREGPRLVATLEDVILPFVQGATRHIGLRLESRQRLGVLGSNGCGKSTLLRVLAGILTPIEGRCEVAVRSAYLDQHLMDLDPQASVLTQLIAASPRAGEAILRRQLAQLGLETGQVTAPSGRLSGGERLKAALARALYAEVPAQLLLLDEPSNHLDLPSLEALEDMLRSYPGALVVVSHDDSFLDSLELTSRLIATEEGWQLT